MGEAGGLWAWRSHLTVLGPGAPSEASTNHLLVREPQGVATSQGPRTPASTHGPLPAAGSRGGGAAQGQRRALDAGSAPCAAWLSPAC